MAMRDLLLPEYDQEMAKTRRLLERIPEDRLDWTPHPKSFTLQALLSHVVNIPTWIPMTLEQEVLDMAPEGQEPWKTPQQGNREAWLNAFDANVAKGRASLAALEDASLGRTWALKAGTKELFSAPKGAVLRGFVFNHLIHHRAQLGLYLRLLDVPVPGIYGPSADETTM
jgi:uncharacterized damage-inducible protein DinB